MEDDIQINNEDENLDDSVVAEEHLGDTVKKLRERLKESEAKAKEYLDSWQRAQAEFVNARKRDEEAKADFLKFAKQDVVAEILPVLDSLSMAVAHGDKNAESIYRQFLGILKRHGLEEENPLGERFDPSRHEAVGQERVENVEDDDKIIDVLQKGYTISGKIIRPAKVKVGHHG